MLCSTLLTDSCDEINDFEALVDAFIGTDGILAPLQRDRSVACRLFSGRRDVRIRNTGKSARFGKMRDVFRRAEGNFSLEFWIHDAKPDPFVDDPATVVFWMRGPAYELTQPMLFSFGGYDPDGLRDCLVRATARWGARYGAGWEGVITPGPFTDPVFDGRMWRGTVEPLTLGPTWLMLLRPEAASRLNAGWRAEHGLAPVVVPIDASNGRRYEMWQISDTPAGLAGDEGDRWVTALGSAMPLATHS